MGSNTTLEREGDVETEVEAPAEAPAATPEAPAEDIVLSAAEKDAIVRTVASEESTPLVDAPTQARGETRAWNQARQLD